MATKSRSKKTTKPAPEDPATENDQLFADFQAKHATAPIAFREIVRDHRRYAAVVAAKSFAGIDMSVFKDEKDLKTFIRWCLRGAKGYKA